MHLGRVVNSNDLLLEQVNEVERESNIFGGCSPMQSGRVLYRKICGQLQNKAGITGQTKLINMETADQYTRGCHPFSLCTRLPGVLTGLGKDLYLCAELLDIQDLWRQETYF